VRFLAWWFSGVAIIVLIFYAIVTIRVAHWIDQRLEPADIAASLTCWSSGDVARRGAIAASEDRRDNIVERMIVWEPGRPRMSPIWWRVRWQFVRHVYRTWWSSPRRQQIYAYVAARMRPCDSPALGAVAR
jgi:hypothetical protein